MPYARSKHPMRYGVSRPEYNRGGRSDVETASFMGTGSRYKGTASTDTELPTKFDQTNWTPFTLLEGADGLYRLALVFMAAWQLNRHTEFWDGQWNTLFAIQLAISCALWLGTGMAFVKNGMDRVANATINGTKAITRDETGNIIYSNPEAEKLLPEVRCGFLYMTARATIDGLVFWLIFEFWDSNKSRPLDCVDQRRLDRNMWLVLLTGALFSFEAISYFLNFVVYSIRKVAGGNFQLYYDL